MTLAAGVRVRQHPPWRSHVGSISMALGGLIMVTSLTVPWAERIEEGRSFSAFTLGSVLAQSRIPFFPGFLLVTAFLAIALAFLGVVAPRLSGLAGALLALSTSFVVAFTCGWALAAPSNSDTTTSAVNLNIGFFLSLGAIALIAVGALLTFGKDLQRAVTGIHESD